MLQYYYISNSTNITYTNNNNMVLPYYNSNIMIM